jgi:uncharacterized protein (TIGR02246 family)
MADAPRELHELFLKYFNSKDLDGLLTLYEDDAVLVAAPGEPAQGGDVIRASLEAFLQLGGQIEFIAEAEPVISGDIALTHGRWRLVPDVGDAMEGETAEVSRRGADGTWRYVIDNPWGSSVLSAPSV